MAAWVYSSGLLAVLSCSCASFTDHLIGGVWTPPPCPLVLFGVQEPMHHAEGCPSCTEQVFFGRAHPCRSTLSGSWMLLWCCLVWLVHGSDMGVSNHVQHRERASGSYNMQVQLWMDNSKLGSRSHANTSLVGLSAAMSTARPCRAALLPQS